MCSVALFVTLLCSSVPAKATIRYWRSRPVYSSLYHANPFIQRALPTRHLRQIFIPTQVRIQLPLVVARRRIVSLSNIPVSSVSLLLHHQPDYNFRRRSQIINGRISRSMNSLGEIRRQRNAFVGRPAVISVDTNPLINTYHAAVRVPSITPQNIHLNRLSSRNRAFRSPLLAESVEEQTSRRSLNREIHSSSSSELQALSISNQQTTNEGLTSARTPLRKNPDVLLNQLPDKNGASGSHIAAENVHQRTSKGSLNRHIQFPGERKVVGVLLKDYAAAEKPLKETSKGHLERSSYRNGALKSPLLAESVDQQTNISALNLKESNDYNRIQDTQNTGDNSISETESTKNIVAAIIAGLNILKQRNSNNNNSNAVMYT